MVRLYGWKLRLYTLASTMTSSGRLVASPELSTLDQMFAARFSTSTHAMRKVLSRNLRVQRTASIQCRTIATGTATARKESLSLREKSSRFVELPSRLAARNLLKAANDLARRTIDRPESLLDSTQNALEDLQESRKPVIACQSPAFRGVFAID